MAQRIIEWRGFLNTAVCLWLLYKRKISTAVSAIFSVVRTTLNHSVTDAVELCDIIDSPDVKMCHVTFVSPRSLKPLVPLFYVLNNILH
jgi:hypothetical protein